MTRRVVVVGNGPLLRDLSQDIDSADFVLRFNEPKVAKGMSGLRTDMLMVNNSGKPMQRRLADPEYRQSPIVQAAREIVFPYHPQTIRNWLIKPNILSRLRGRRADWTLEAIDVLGAAGKEVRIMPPSFYSEGCAELGIPSEKMRTVFPSTGYLGLRLMCERFPAPTHRIEVCGFSWEGWKRHAWADERSWVENKIANGLLFMIE